jgi:hypothetical protein
VENRPDEIARLQSGAQHALQHPEELEPRAAMQNVRRILRLWHEPAFSTPAAWALFDHTIVSSDPVSRPLPSWMLVRETVWDRPHDMGRFADPLQGLREGFAAPPTITVHDGHIARKAVELWFQEAARLLIAPLGVEAPWGVDGEMWGIEVSRPFLQVRLEWWGDGPTPWAEFTRAVAWLHKQFTDAVRADDPLA